jgi:hypothetical protein
VRHHGWLLAVASVLLVTSPAHAAPTQMRALPFPVHEHERVLADGGRLLVHQNEPGRRSRVLDVVSGRTRVRRTPRGCPGLAQMAGDMLLLRCSESRLAIVSARSGRRVRAPALHTMLATPECRQYGRELDV